MSVAANQSAVDGAFGKGAGPRTDKGAVLADLRARIRQLEGYSGGTRSISCPMGVHDMDTALADGGLPVGCLHELAPARPGDGGAAVAFAAAMIGVVSGGIPGAQDRPVLWIGPERNLYPPGLIRFGLSPGRMIHLKVRRPAEMLWAMEEGLRCAGLVAAVVETARIDLTASRRLQLAAETAGVTGLVLTSSSDDGRQAEGALEFPVASAATTRWRVAAASSCAEAGFSGFALPRWRVELRRCRGGRPGLWNLEWREGRLQETGSEVGRGTTDDGDGMAAMDIKPARLVWAG